jgi:hypothetical protein
LYLLADSERHEDLGNVDIGHFGSVFGVVFRDIPAYATAKNLNKFLIFI